MFYFLAVCLTLSNRMEYIWKIFSPRLFIIFFKTLSIFFPMNSRILSQIFCRKIICFVEKWKGLLTGGLAWKQLWEFSNNFVPNQKHYTCFRKFCQSTIKQFAGCLFESVGNSLEIVHKFILTICAGKFTLLEKKTENFYQKFKQPFLWQAFSS